MRTRTVAGRTVIDFNYTRTDYAESSHRTGSVCKRGSRLAVCAYQSNDVATDPLAEVEECAAMAVGPKTLAKMIETALAGGVTNSTVKSEFGRWLRLYKHGRYIKFQAPCGAWGQMTVGEARKLAEAVRAL